MTNTQPRKPKRLELERHKAIAKDLTEMHDRLATILDELTTAYTIGEVFIIKARLVVRNLERTQDALNLKVAVEHGREHLGLYVNAPGTFREEV